MRYRDLGRTGLRVSELTIGVCAGNDARETRATLALGLERGVNAATLDADDDAAVTLLSEALAQKGDSQALHILARATSLVPFDLPSPHVPAWQAYPGRHIRAEAERLLASLGVERLALLQLHAWCPEWLGEGDWLETLDRLRAEGKIAGFGISLFDHDVNAALETVASGAIDAVQLMYNIFDQGAAATLFASCAAHGVGVVVRSPLYYGALTPDFARQQPVFSEFDWRNSYFYDDHRHETAERVRKLAPLVEAPDRSITDLALRFSLSHAAVSTLAVGMHQRGHLEANLEALARGSVDAGRVAALARHKWLCG
jgi:aryl-alcohol dehydrogenase-like predicted oxidoreductase